MTEQMEFDLATYINTVVVYERKLMLNPESTIPGNAEGEELMLGLEKARKDLNRFLYRELKRELTLTEVTELHMLTDQISAAFHLFLYIPKVSMRLTEYLAKSPEIMAPGGDVSRLTNLLMDQKTIQEDELAMADTQRLMYYFERQCERLMEQFRQFKPLPKAKGKSSGKVFRPIPMLEVIIHVPHLFDRLMHENSSPAELENVLRELDKINSLVDGPIVAARKALVLLALDRPLVALELLEPHQDNNLCFGVKARVLAALGRHEEVFQMRRTQQGQAITKNWQA